MCAIRFVDHSEDLLLRCPNGVQDPGKYPYRGCTKGMAVADVDNDGTLDLYVSHHLTSPSELILAFATDAPVNCLIDVDVDEHGPTFFDIDRDGDLDLMEAVGGMQGRPIDPNDPRHWNTVHENVEGQLSVENTARNYGIDYGPGRSYSITPINYNGIASGVFLGTMARSDGTYPATLMLQQSSGVYQNWTIFDDPQYFSGADFGIGAHLDTDDLIDLVVIQGETLKTIFSIDEDPDPADVFVHDLSGEWPDYISDIQVADFTGDLQQEIFVTTHPREIDRLFGVQPDGTLADVTGARFNGLKMNSLNATVGDFDNDGDVDITILHARWSRMVGDMVTYTIWSNDGTGHFTAEHHGLPEVPGKSDKIISGDFNNDGWLDLLLTTGDGMWLTYPDPTKRADGVYVLLISEGGANNWLNISLKGVDAETSGLGARVYVTTPDGQVQMREQDSGNHAWVQDSMRLHFGLGEHAKASEIRIVWPDGDTEVLQDVAANQHLTITETVGTSVDSIVVEARGTAAFGAFPELQVLVDGNLCGTETVTGETETYTFVVPDLDTATSLAIRFPNDAYDPAAGADRNLIVTKVIAGGAELAITDAVYDRDGPAMPDIDGQTGLWWAGQLEFALEPPTPPQADNVVVEARGTAAFGAYPELQVLVDENLFGTETVTGETETYTFAVPDLDTASSLAIRFANDARDPVTGNDRNLIVSKVVANGQELAIGDAFYDRDAPTMLDIDGQSGMWWQGNLVFDIDALLT